MFTLQKRKNTVLINSENPVSVPDITKKLRLYTEQNRGFPTIKYDKIKQYNLLSGIIVSVVILGIFVVGLFTCKKIIVKLKYGEFIYLRIKIKK